MSLTYRSMLGQLEKDKQKKDQQALSLQNVQEPEAASKKNTSLADKMLKSTIGLTTDEIQTKKRTNPYGSEYLDTKYQQTVNILSNVQKKTGIQADPWADAKELTDIFGKTVRRSHDILGGARGTDYLAIGEDEFQKALRATIYKYQNGQQYKTVTDYLLNEETKNYQDYAAMIQGQMGPLGDQEKLKRIVEWGGGKVQPGTRQKAQAAAAEATDYQLNELLEGAKTEGEKQIFQMEKDRREKAGISEEEQKRRTALEDEYLAAKYEAENGFHFDTGLPYSTAEREAAQKRADELLMELEGSNLPEGEAVREYKEWQAAGEDTLFTNRYTQEQQQQAADWNDVILGRYSGNDPKKRQTADKIAALEQERDKAEWESLYGASAETGETLTPAEIAERQQKALETRARISAEEAQAKGEMQSAQEALQSIRTAQHGEGDWLRLWGADTKLALTNLYKGFADFVGGIAKPFELVGRIGENLLTGNNETIGDAILNVYNGNGIFASQEKINKDSAKEAATEAYNAQMAISDSMLLDVANEVYINFVEQIPDILMNIWTYGGKAGGDMAVRAQAAAMKLINSQDMGQVQKLVTNMTGNTSFWTAYIREWGSDKDELEEKGTPKWLSSTLATLTALQNAAIEIGGVQEIGVPGKEEGLLKTAFEEGHEELVQGATSGAMQAMGRAAAGESTPFISMEPGKTAVLNVPDLAHEALVGGLAGFAMSGGANVASNIKGGINNKIQTGRNDKATGALIKPETDEMLKNLAATMSGEPAELAQKYTPGKANAKQRGALFRSVMKGLAGSYRSILVDRLAQDFNEAGISDDASHAIMQMMAGQALSEEQIQTMAKDSQAMDALYEAMGMKDKQTGQDAPKADKETPRGKLAPESRRLELEPLPGFEAEEETEDIVTTTEQSVQAQPVANMEQTGQAMPGAGTAGRNMQPETRRAGLDAVETAQAAPSAAQEGQNGETEANGQGTAETRQEAPEAAKTGMEQPLFENSQTQPMANPAKQTGQAAPENGAMGKELAPENRRQGLETVQAETGSSSEMPNSSTHGSVMQVTIDQDSGAVEARMEDGARVALEDAGLTEEQQQVAQGAADLPQEAQAAMTGAYDAGQAVKTFVNGFRRIYKAVSQGVSLKNIKSLYSNDLTEEQKREAVAAGKTAYLKDRAEAAADTLKTLKNLEKQKIKFKFLSDRNETGSGVYLARVRNGLSEAAKATLLVADKLAKEYGAQIRVYDHMSANGSYQTGSNIINVALDAEGNMLGRTISHELFHFAKEWSRDAGDKLQKYILDTLRSKEGFDFEQRKAAIIEQYSGGLEDETDIDAELANEQNNKPMTTEEAEEEMAAEGMLDVIDTEENLQGIFKATQDKGLLERIKNWLFDAAKKIKQALNDLAWNHPEVRALKDDAEYFQGLAERFKEALAQAAENYRMSQRGLYDTAKADPDVQAYLEAVQDDITPEAALTEADGLASRLFIRAEKDWIAAHMDEYEQGFEKFKEAIKAFGSGKVGIVKAFQDQGLDVPEKALFPVLGYAGRQMVSADTQAEKAGGGERMQIRADEKGPYVDVDVDQEQFDGLTMPKMQKKALQILREKYVGKTFDFQGNPATMFKRDPDHYAYFTYPVDKNKRETKMRGAAELDNILKIGEYERREDDDGSHPEMKDWEYYKTRFKFGNSPIYDFEIKVGHRITGETEIYDIEPYQNNGSTVNDVPTADAARRSPTVDSASEDSVAQDDGNVNKQFSFRASSQDAEYMRAAENGDEETAQRMVDEAAENAMAGSKIRDEDGKLLTVYHGTSERFTVFDMNKGRANMDIQGAFFSPWDVDAAGYGKNVGRYYLDIKNPADESTGYKALRIFQGQNEAGKKAKEYLIKQGYDGVNNENMEYIAFFPEQIKSADPITYDENGDIIPLSERFQEGNPDIRYSQRAVTDDAETQEALEEVTDDPELYAQVAADADIRAAWQLLMRLHRLTTQGGENALIRKGAFEARLSEIVKKIEEKTGTKYGPIKLRNALRKIYQAMEQSQYSPGEILQYARDLMKDVLDASPGVLVEQDETTKDILAELKRRRFFLTDDQKNEIKNTYGTISAFINKNFGTLHIVKQDNKTAGLEDVWLEGLAPKLPGVFAEDTSPLDMPAILDAWLETTKEKKYAGEFGHNIGAYATDLALNAMLDFYDVPGALKTKRDIREEYKETILDQQTKIRQLTEAARGAMDQAKLTYEEKYKNRIEKAKERREETERKQKLRSQITRDVRAINRLNVTNSDTSHVPQAMQAAALKAVEPFMAGSGVFSGAEMMRLAREYKLLEARKGEVGGFDDDILTTIDGLAEKLNGRSLAKLDEAELQDLADTMGNLRKIIADENAAFLNGRKTTVDALSGRLKADMQARGQAKQGPIAKAARTFRYLEETPVYFADRVGGVIKDMIYDFFDGETTWADVIDAAIQYKDKMLEKYHVADWINDKKHARFVTQNGDQIELNKQEALTLYAQWKRETSNKLQNANHLRVGGFMYGKDAKYKGVDTLRPHPLTDSDMQMIKSYLTEEEMAFADEMVKYLSEDMAKLGNEVSMRLYGYNKYTEPYYFPYSTDKRFLASDLTQNESEQVKQPKSKGFTKALMQNAATPLTVGNFMGMWGNHVNEMALYKGFAETVDTMSRVFNQRIPGAIRTDSATGAEFATPAESNWVEMERALGEEGVRYLRTLVRDISGGVRADERGFAAKGLSMFKKGAVLGNLSVVLQQPTAYARAMDMINPIYLNLVSKETAHLAKNIQEMYEYSGVAKIKKMGRFDTGTGKGAIQLLTEGTEDRNAAQKVLAGIDTVAGIGAEKADEWTWGLLWGAVKKETEHTHPELTPGSEAFLKATAERFNDICRHTQVYDSVMSKSTWMRSNSIMDKTMTSFMAEPTLTTNMLLAAMQKFNQPGGKKKIARAAGVFLVNSLLVALAKSIMTATRRKDDEGRTWLEKYLAESAGNFLEDISPFGIASMIPWARDAVSLMEGYDVKRSDMDAVEQLMKGYKTLNRFIKGENVSLEDAIQNTVGPVANMFGIPAKNLWRDAEAIIRNVFGGASANEPTTGRDIKYSVLDSLQMGPISLWDSSNKAYYDRMEQALLAGDKTKYEELQRYLEETLQVKPDSITSGVKNEIKDSFTRSLISDDKAMKLLQDQFGMDHDKSWEEVEKWRQTAAHADDEEYNYSKYREVLVLVKEGKDITAAAKKLTDNTKTKQTTIDSQIQSAIGGWYRDGEITQQQAKEKLKKYLNITDSDDLHWLFDKWDYMTTGAEDNYSQYVDVYKAVDSNGSITAAMKEMTQYGYEEKEVKSKIKSHLGEQYRDGTITKATATAKLKKYTGITDENDLYWIFDEWDYKKKNANNKNAEDYGKYKSFYKAVETGANLQSEIARYTTHGVEESTLKTQITSQYKKLYLEYYQTNLSKAANLKAYLVQAYVLLGDSRSKAMKKVDDWTKDLNKKK